MKQITVLFIFLFSFYSAAQDKSDELPGNAPVKKDLLLSSMQINSRPGYNIKDRLLLASETKDEKEKTEQQQLEKSVSRTGDFKLSTGLLYFAGAAAIAAIIYFLVPDNKPSPEKTFTFGLPVTPK